MDKVFLFSCLFHIRRLGIFGADADSFVSDEEDAADIVGGSINRKIREKIAVSAKLVANEFGCRLGFVKREDLAAGAFGQLLDNGSGLGLVETVGSAGAVGNFQR